MLKFFNTLTKKKEEFKPLKGKKVGMYDCGPTVYSYPHIGNLRRYIFSDTLRRYLEYQGFKVKQVRNITDVGHLTQDDINKGEDKIVKAARAEKKSPLEIARYYEKAFFEDTDKLKILRPHESPRATEHIKEIIEAVEELLEKGYAYKTSDGIYYDISKFKNYGNLSGNTPERLAFRLNSGQAEKRFGRSEVKKGDKKSPNDFALWLLAPKDHLLKWPSPFGEGYPGWHIECSVMSAKYLGPSFEIHTGGEDNIFPHHENEIAQSESLSGKTFVKYWLHSRHLQLSGSKMAKSAGKIFRLKDLKEKGFEPRDFRMLSLMSHYRSLMDFSFESLDQAKKNLKRVDEFLERLEKIDGGGRGSAKKEIRILREKFITSMDDDLNTPLVFSHIFDFVNKINARIDKNEVSKKDAKEIIKTFADFDRVFAVFKKGEEKIPDKVLELACEREEARKQGNFKEADLIRSQIIKLGFKVKDTTEGSEISRK